MTHDNDKPKIVDSDCLKAFDNLYAYLNDELKDPHALAEIEHHLEHCRSCYSRAQVEREINKRLKQSGQPEAPASLQNRLKKIIDSF